LKGDIKATLMMGYIMGCACFKGMKIIVLILVNKSFAHFFYVPQLMLNFMKNERVSPSLTLSSLKVLQNYFFVKNYEKF